jgi:hypothetical protein
VTTPPSSPPNGHLRREPAGAVKGAQRPVCGRTLDGVEDSRILAFPGWSASPQPTQTAVAFTLNQYTPTRASPRSSARNATPREALAARGSVYLLVALLGATRKWLRDRAASARFGGQTDRERANARTPSEYRLAPS